MAPDLCLIILAVCATATWAASVPDQWRFCHSKDLPKALLKSHPFNAAPGSTVEVSCERKYVADSPRITCRDGQWSDPEPPCKLVDCSYPEIPREGHFKFGCTTFNCTATYVCPEGYWYNGTSTRICQRNQTWSGTMGDCKPVLCPALSDPVNGYVNQVNRSHRARATVVCDEGYVYSRPNVRHCQDDNTWDGEEGVCQVLQCPEMPDPPHGRFLLSHRSYLAEATLECEEGYTYRNSPTLICQGNGHWSGNISNCEEVHCPDIEPAEIGFLSETKGKYQDVITLQCPSGHTQNGPSSITCTAAGKWSGAIGHCSKPLSSGQIVAIVLSVLIIAGVIIFIVLMIRWRKRQRNRRNEAEDLPLLRGSQHFYCSFLMRGHLPEVYSRVDSKEYKKLKSLIERKVKTSVKNRLDKRKIERVIVVFICQKKNKVFLEIDFEKAVQEDAVLRDAIIEALAPKQEDFQHSIIPQSISFTENPVQKILIDVHKKINVMDKGFDKPLDIERRYVKLKHAPRGTSKTMRLSDLPDHYSYQLDTLCWKDVQGEDLIKGDEFEKYILIRGRAGFGKWPLLKWFVSRWANGDWATNFKVIFTINLRYIINIARTMDLAELLSLYSVYNTGDSNVTVDAEWLRENEGQIGIILDGVDGIQDFKDKWQEDNQHEADLDREETPLDLCLALLKRRCLPKSTLVVISSPFEELGLIVDDLENSDQNFMLIDLAGLSRPQVTSFVAKIVPDADLSVVEKAFDTSPILLSVATIPFFCGAICQVLKHDKVLPELTTYSQITAFIIQKCIEWSEQDEPSIRKHLTELSKIAYHGIEGRGFKGPPRLSFDKGKLPSWINKDILENVCDTGLAVENMIENAKEPEESRALMRFVHLWFQQLLAMAHLLSLDTLETELAALMNSGCYNLAVLFVYGLAFNRQYDALNNIRNQINEPEENLASRGEAVNDGAEEQKRILEKAAINVPDELQVLQIIFESQSKDFAVKVGEERFQGEIRIIDKKMTLANVVALIYLLENSPSTNGLCLQNTELDSTSIKKLAKFLKKQQTVGSVEIIDNSIGDEDVEEVLYYPISSSKSLHTLIFRSNSMTDNGVKAIASAACNNSSLKRLTLGGSHITEKGATSVIKKLMSVDHLKDVSLWIRLVTENGMKLIAESVEPKATMTVHLRLIKDPDGIQMKYKGHKKIIVEKWPERTNDNTAQT